MENRKIRHGIRTKFWIWESITCREDVSILQRPSKNDTFDQIWKMDVVFQKYLIFTKITKHNKKNKSIIFRRNSLTRINLHSYVFPFIMKNQGLRRSK